MKHEDDKISETPAIDFHAAEFNVIDDLNDWAPGCLSYEPLGDVMTADMHHQMERRRNRPCGAPAEDAAAREDHEFKAALPESQEKAPALTVVSHGRTLIIDTDARRAEDCASRLDAQGLQCAIVLTSAQKVAGQGYWGPLRADSLSVSGAFGGFSATAAVNGDRKPLAELLADKDLSFDLVLDLQPEPSYAGELLPAGYYVPGRDLSGLEGIIAEMPQMRGRFTKPQFTAFLSDRCIHGRSRKRECSRCADACPYGAIESVDRKITVNPFICQGCGACALVCPTSAIRLLEPSREVLLEAMRQAVDEGRARHDQPPALLISNRDAAGDAVDDRNIHFRVEQIGHAGLELLLAALAQGAGAVSVACGPQNTASIQKEVQWQVQMARAILQGLGLPADAVRLHEDADIGSARPALPVLPPLRDALVAPDGRAGIRLAVQHLYEQSSAATAELPMPDGTPFGSVNVDPSGCTLCMACAVACPAGALRAGGDTPRLSFIESHCHQCGLCREACPEGAIELAPRILCEPATVETPVVLREAEPFRCVVCGAPFATQAMVNRMLDKLAGHWMYASERQRRRLQMCHVCRTRDALQSEDRKTWMR